MEKSIGALWKKESKDGKIYFSGNIEIAEGNKIRVVVFANDRKKNEREPDYRIYETEAKK